MKRIIKAGFMMLLGAAIWMNGGDVKEAKAQECASGGSVLHLEGYSVCNYIGGNCIQHPPGQIPPICQPQPQRPTNTRSVPPKPSSYGAVALNKRTGIVGTSTNQISKQASIDTALQRCGNGCELSTWYANQCMAYAYGTPSGSSNGRSFIVMGLTKRKAEKNALSECGAEFKNCKVLLSECSLP